jgi:predicted ribosomally synthesized peptide with SipW-like signal peptide
MTMDRKVLTAILVIGLVATMAGAGTFSYFSDTETSTGNKFTAGTLDLKVDNKDDPLVVHIELSDIAPGWSQKYKWVLKNTGSISGKVRVEFSPITNNENGVNEPEAIAEAEPYGYQGARATLGDPNAGELGEYLKFGLLKGDGFNYWGPGTDNSGPPAYGQKWGLNKLGGNTYDTGEKLDPGQTLNLYLNLSLDTNLKAWDGCWSHDIDDNVIQGDSVIFDIIFHLDQAP